jgi:hypothetical protein
MIAAMAEARPFYPLVVRNRAPLVARGFILLWLAVCATVSATAWNARPPDPDRLWPWILLLFWAVGLFALRWSFTAETAKLIVSGPACAEIHRGRPLRRRRHTLDRLNLSLAETQGSDGDAYFHLIADAPDGPLILAEGRRRATLLALKDKVERALG